MFRFQALFGPPKNSLRTDLGQIQPNTKYQTIVIVVVGVIAAVLWHSVDRAVNHITARMNLEANL